jgi:hypothetical protein
MLKKLLVPTLVLTMSAIAGIGCRDNSGNATPYVPDASGDAPVDGGSPDTEETDTAPTDATPSDATTGDASDTSDASDATKTDAAGDATDATAG